MNKSPVLIGDRELTSENVLLSPNPEEADLVGSNPTLSASLRRAYGWQAESSG